MWKSRLHISGKFIVGLLICIALLAPELGALRGSAVVLQAKSKAAEQKESKNGSDNEQSAGINNATKSPFTGIPQIDYLLDPNLPRELNGHNLTDYPFYNAVPEDIDFKCDGLHDGFYASVLHKCQVYHHCLYGTRYDFLCANYTAFDQKTFICHFVSEVDCDNSPKYFQRNEALYKEASTTTTTTTTTSAPSTSTTHSPPDAVVSRTGNNGGNGPRRRRPHRRRRPMYDYYYDDDEYADTEYYEDEVLPANHRRIPHKKHKFQSSGSGNDGQVADTDYDLNVEQVKPSVRSSNGASVYDRPRIAPKIRRPVPKSERNKYEYTPKQQSSTSVASSSSDSSTTLQKQPSQQYGKNKQSAHNPEEYYDDEEYDYVANQKSNTPKNKPHAAVDYDSPTGFGETRRYVVNRYRSRMQPVRKRTEMVYDDYEVEERPIRTNRRKVEYINRYDGERLRNSRPQSAHRLKSPRVDDSGSVPTHKTTSHATQQRKRIHNEEHRGNGGRRAQDQRPVYNDEEEYYYDDEEIEEAGVVKPYKRNRRPNVAAYSDKPKENPAYDGTKFDNESDKEMSERESEDEQIDSVTGKVSYKTPPPTQRDGKSSNTSNVEKLSNYQQTYDQTSEFERPLENENKTKPKTVFKNQIIRNMDPTEKLNTGIVNTDTNTVKNIQTENYSRPQSGSVSETQKYLKPIKISVETTSTTTESNGRELYYDVNSKYREEYVPNLSNGNLLFHNSEQDYKKKDLITANDTKVQNRPIPAVTSYRHFTVIPTHKPQYLSSEIQVPNNRYTTYEEGGNEFATELKLPTRLPNHIPKQITANQPTNYYQNPFPSNKHSDMLQNINQNSSNLYSQTDYTNMFSAQNTPSIANQRNSQIRTFRVNKNDPTKQTEIGINSYNSAFVPDTRQSFEHSQSQNIINNYNQAHSLHANANKDNSYTTNSVVSFPQQPPVTYDITAPGPSAQAADINTDISKKYSELYPATYTTNEDYDTTLNDALHPVTNYGYSSSLPVQQRPRRIILRENNNRLPSNYITNGSNTNIPRSHEHYK